MLTTALHLLGTGVAAGLVTILVTGLRCMSRPGITSTQTRLTARHTLIGAGIFILFFCCVIGTAFLLDLPTQD